MTIFWFISSGFFTFILSSAGAPAPVVKLQWPADGKARTVSEKGEAWLEFSGPDPGFSIIYYQFAIKRHEKADYIFIDYRISDIVFLFL